MTGQFDIRKITGLTKKEVEEKLKKEGYNELPSSKKRSILQIIFEVLKEPMFLLLVACGTIYLFLGDVQEAIVLLFSVFVIMGITIYQERKTENALDALRDLSSPRALVIRDGEQVRIAGKEVVRGDIIILAEGDRVPADAEVLWCSNLTVDESLLTGESVAVRKKPGEKESGKMERPGGDDLPYIFSGTLVVTGQGVARVLETAEETEIGKIGKALKTLEPEETPLQKETGKLVKIFATVGLILCVLVVVIYGLTRGNWIQGFLVGLAFAMSILPEEFPVVLTVFLALGAWRISQNRVLTRRVPAVETLGATTVLCTDKTGTLTQNRMSVAMLNINDEFYKIEENKQVPENFDELIMYGILASQKDPFDPMEKSLQKLGNFTLESEEKLYEELPIAKEYPLSDKLLALSYAWKKQDEEGYIIGAKGAPEAVADLCHLSKEETAEIVKKVKKMAAEGLRVLGVAKSQFSQKKLPADQHDFKFQFVGLVGFADPIHPTVPDAIKECYNAGIRVIMITGDYAGTARNIARQIGLTPSEEVISGYELEEMSDEELKERVKTVNIFARVVPEQKLKLVNALKAHDNIVAMTGDGVNDAPALKSSHIGIAMGGRGTDVAREASSLVLLDDDFNSIVKAVRMGRRIFANIKKAMAFIFSVHVPIVGLSMIPVFLKWPLILTPVHIVFLELIIDPTCSVVFEAEPEEKDIMNRPPRDPKASLFSGKMLGFSILQGVGVLIVTLIIFAIAYYRGQGEVEARTLCFTTLILSNIGLILTNRSWSRNVIESMKIPNNVIWWVLGGTMAVLASSLYIPFVRNLFKFTTLHPNDLLICLAGGIVSLLWCEVLKVFYKKKG